MDEDAFGEFDNPWEEVERIIEDLDRLRELLGVAFRSYRDGRFDPHQGFVDGVEPDEWAREVGYLFG